MRLLVLGGTAFLGRALVEAAIARRHEVTLFTRGRTNPDLFPELERLRGDRESDLAPLAGREFDAVLDTSGYVPRVVAATAGLLAGTVERYVFVSSVSVYADGLRLTETSPIRRADDPASEDVGAHYGALKALCEQATEAAFPGRTVVLRPGLVVGPHDYTGRFSYWPRRVAEGGDVLAPGRPGARVYVIDVRDLADWTIRLVESGSIGVFNVVGPAEPLTFGELLERCRVVTGADARFVWVADDFLVDRGVVPYTELPLWIPDAAGGHPEIDVTRAIAAGLGFRPVDDTIRDVLGYGGYDARTAGAFGLPRPAAGLDAERERALLAEWHAQAG
jgi:2'-hydroxyisoflavone reductase